MYTYVGSGYFLDSKFWISMFLVFLRKMNIFGSMKIMWIFFGGNHKIGLVWGSFLSILGSFLKVKVQNWDIFWVAKISNIFGVLEIPDIFGGWAVDAGSEPTIRKKIEYPPGIPRLMFSILISTLAKIKCKDVLDVLALSCNHVSEAVEWKPAMHGNNYPNLNDFK